LSAHPLAPLLSPRSIAIVGASRRADTPGHDMVRMLARGGFAGTVHAINPGYDAIECYPCVPRLSDLPAPPDLAVLSVRNERLEATLAEAIAAGTRAAVIFASGFLDADGVPLQGILYKPENFDPARKYPLLVYIYERLTQGHNQCGRPTANGFSRQAYTRPTIKTSVPARTHHRLNLRARIAATWF
jgi:predicted CoA-binding protein